MTSSSVRRCVAPSQVLGFAEDNTHGRIGRPQAAIQSGLPVSVPAMTVNRVCGPGAQGAATAYSEVLAGVRA